MPSVDTPDLFDTVAGSKPASSGRFAHVALEQGIDASAGGLTYSIPAMLADIAIGDRVVVPLGRGNKPATGYVVDISDRTDFARTKPIISRDPQGLSLPRDLVDLAKWIAGYYCCPLGMVFTTMLPAAVKRGTGMVTRTFVREMADSGRRMANGEEKGVKLTKLQQLVLDAARERVSHGEPWVEMKRLADLAGAKSLTPVKQLMAKGVLESKQERGVEAEWSESSQRMDTPAEEIALSRSQEKAVEKLVASVHQGFSVHLLYGVTGSGKTEVYLRLIEHLLAEKKEIPSAIHHPPSTIPLPGAIVLVPEIALTPQTVARFLGRFDGVAVLHSGLSSAQRHEQWRRIRDGKARIVVGARSAIFAPLANLGVIIVDEEHEPSYKQDQLPRYHARDVAIKRGQLLGVPVVLGSATPSLESYFNATVVKEMADGGWRMADGGDEKKKSPTNTLKSQDSGLRSPRYHLLELPDRVTGLKLPEVEIVDMTEERRKRYEHSGSSGIHLLSLRLETALRQTIDAGGQTMLLLNRRGFANYIACPDHRCGWLMTCDFCDAAMVYHKDAKLPTGGMVQCHHCTAEQLLPAYCPVCSKKVTVFGLGTQRVEEEIEKKFLGVKMLRMDSDAMRSGLDYDRSLERFRRGEINILVGTQMIAKGLDFPNVRLVGVISADTALHMPDFRASERTFQLIAQVAGRAGRGDHVSAVIVQTFNPTDAAIVLASQHDYPTFARREIDLRGQVGLPPHTRMARIVVRDTDFTACYAAVKTLADRLVAINREQGGAVRIRGPMPCPIARIGGFHRQQIELIAPDAGTLQKLLTAARNAKELKSDIKMAVDVDPVSLL